MDVLPSPPVLSYPDGGQQTPASLQAIKQLVCLLLAREDASLMERLAPLPVAGPALLASLGELPAVDLLATIRRQRLMCLLHGDPYVEELLPALWPSIHAGRGFSSPSSFQPHLQDQLPVPAGQIGVGDWRASGLKPPTHSQHVATAISIICGSH